MSEAWESYCENQKSEILHHFVSRCRALGKKNPTKTKHQITVTLTISLYASNAKIRMQVLLCFFQMLPTFVTLQKACLLSSCLLHYLQLAIYSQMASHMAKLRESRNGGALGAPTLQGTSAAGTGAGPARALQKKQFPQLVCDWVSVSLSLHV